MLEHALRALQRRGSLVHGNGRACYLLGEALRELSRYEEALLPLERSADLMPDDIRIWLALGWCYKRTGQLAKAIEALERAVKIDTNFRDMIPDESDFNPLRHDPEFIALTSVIV